MGRNLANLELLVIVASIFRRYEFVLEAPTAEVRSMMYFFSPWRVVLIPVLQLDTREGFLRKPVECKVVMKRRNV